MQYLVDEAEMAAIRADRLKLAQLPGGVEHLRALTEVCQLVATKMVEVPAADQDGIAPSLRAHGCPHVRDHRGERYQTRYCDRCPVAGVCPQTKYWSK
jgi:hypothetical protein